MYSTSRDFKLAWLGIKDCRCVRVLSFRVRFQSIPQKPVSNPTEKQLLSWLKATDNDIGPADSSIAGLVFMVVGAGRSAVNGCNDCLQSRTLLMRVSLVYRRTREHSASLCI